MRWVLISPYFDVTAYGVRILASILKRSGHTVRMIFLPNRAKSSPDFAASYPQKVLRQVGELCRGFDLVGVSVMTNYLPRAVEISQAVRRASEAKVIWGGIHPSIRPKECLQWADASCVGEADDSILEFTARFAQAGLPVHCPGFLTREDGGDVPSEMPILVQDLDSLPFPDYALEDDHALMPDGEVRRIDVLDMQRLMGEIVVTRLPGHVIYQSMASRGCPMRCTYCCNDFFKALYQGQPFLRRRGTEQIISEIEAARSKIPTISFISFSDDCFLAAPEAEIEAFAQAYRTRIGLPLFCLATPAAVSERRITALRDAGLTTLQMGIETGSQRIQSLYGRTVKNETVLKATRILHDLCADRVKLLYDVIVDCPYEDREDALDTLRLLQRIPYPYELTVFSLVLYPGTALHDQAVADGMILDEHREIYEKQYNLRRVTYPNLLITLANRNVSKRLIAAFASGPAVWILGSRQAQPVLKWAVWAVQRLWGRRDPWGYF